MPENLKNIFFSNNFITKLGNTILDVYPAFDTIEFNQLIYGDEWDSMELKQKMHHLMHCLEATMPGDYPSALNILTEVAPNFTSFDAMIFPDYVESYGLDHWDISIPALALFTQYCSSEFAIRPFLEKEPEQGMRQMQEWALDENLHLRRLASEGCRPRLPWAMALNLFKKDPKPIIPILATLKDDPSEYVRKSVANNLNDISKDHPDLVLDICGQWYGKSKNTDWIVKRACRTMLKAGNTRALLFFGFGDPEHILIEDLKFDKQRLSIGDEFRFTIEMRLDKTEAYQIRLEYGIYFVKANGKLSRKVFQIREAIYEPGKHVISRKHSFKNLSTRKHYPGQHQLSIIVNGIEKVKANFDIEARI